MITPCFRCSGLLVSESFSAPGIQEILKTAKCVNCGVVYDPLILYNQSSQEIRRRISCSQNEQPSGRGFGRKRRVLTRG